MRSASAPQGAERGEETSVPASLARAARAGRRSGRGEVPVVRACRTMGRHWEPGLLRREGVVIEAGNRLGKLDKVCQTMGDNMRGSHRALMTFQALYDHLLSMRGGRRRLP